MDETERMRHTLSHVLAGAVRELYPGVKLGIGPAIENGFYYDFDFGKVKISDSDLAKIEKKMREIIKQDLKMQRRVVSKEEALAWAKENGEKYKLELIEELGDGGGDEVDSSDAGGDKTGRTGDAGDDKAGDGGGDEADTDEADNTGEISFYDMGEVFTDLCKGPHVESLKEIGAFGLTRVAGAYWRGDEKNPMLTRIYGVAFKTQEELDNFLKQQEEAKQRDHRRLGKELDLFCFSNLVGSGLPLFTPRGTILRDLLNEFAQGYRVDREYKKVCISHIANIELYKTSGHYEKFPEMLQFTSQESGDHLALKPVSCPHHSQIYASQPRSYKDLPIKYLETTMVYRDERKGELGGLSRVRAITQDDSHVFCTEEQVGEIFGELIESAKDLYEKIDMRLRLRLSFRDDKDGYIGTPEMWAKAEQAIQAMADKFEMDYFVGVGEAAMYGPKMDFMAVDALGREWQLATVQLDYALPERFKLEYTAEDGSKKTPIMIHCALVGSIERFMSVYLEHTAGWLPMWCAPENVRILTVNDKVGEYVNKIADVLEGVVLDEPIVGNKLRWGVDDSADSLGKKIRRATEMKIPVVLIVGPKDVKSKEVSVRLRDAEEKVKLDKLGEFLKNLE